MGNAYKVGTSISDAQSAGANAAEGYLLSLYVNSWKAARGIRERPHEPTEADMRNLAELACESGYRTPELKQAFTQGFLFRYERGYPPKEYNL